jgi:8-oxo-dGTP diphosphatase
MPPVGFAAAPSPVVGLSALVLRDDEILMIRRGRTPYAGAWSLPGGKLIWGETIQEALRREVLEETGLVVRIGSLAGVVESIDPDGAFHYVILDYFAEASGGDLRPGNDAIDARWVSLHRVTQLDTTPGLIGYLDNLGLLLGG